MVARPVIGVISGRCEASFSRIGNRLGIWEFLHYESMDWNEDGVGKRNTPNDDEKGEK